MSLEVPSRPQVVGFDGLHRVGKGTQAEMLTRHLLLEGKTSLTVRGDGTREGLGQTPGDPLSPEWQERSRRLKSIDRTVEGWNLASYILMKELDARIHSAEAPDYLIIDRGIISRAAFLLHRGVLKRKRRARLDELYPDAALDDSFDINNVIPDVIFDMQVDDPDILFDRLDLNDPKYDFRAQNIRGGFDSAAQASLYLPKNIEKRVEYIDATQPIDVIHAHVLGRLGLKLSLAD
jgi:thymidylate kinase